MAILLVLCLAACTGTGSDDPGSSPDPELVQQLEELAGVAEATVEAEEFDSESTWTTVQVTMVEGPSPDDVAAAIEAVREARAEFSDYTGIVRLADADGDAVVETGGTSEDGAPDQARWVLAAAQAVPDAQVAVAGDRVTATTPAATNASLATTAETLSDADGLAGASVRVQTADPYDDREGAPVLSVGGAYDDLPALPGIVADAVATLASSRPAVDVAEVRVSGSAAVPILSVRLVETDFAGVVPSASRDREELWPAARDLLDLLLADHPRFGLLVEVGPRASSGIAFIDVRTDGARPTYSMGRGWRRLVAAHLRRNR